MLSDELLHDMQLLKGQALGAASAEGAVLGGREKDWLSPATGHHADESHARAGAGDRGEVVGQNLAVAGVGRADDVGIVLVFVVNGVRRRVSHLEAGVAETVQGPGLIMCL